MNILQNKTARYGLALLVIMVSALLRLLLPDVLSQAPYLGFYPAVVVAATLGGVGPGLFATFGSLLFVNFVFIQFDFLNYGLQMRNVIWIVGGIGVSLLAGRLLDSRMRSDKVNVELKVANNELHRREKKLLESEARLSAFYEAGIIGVIYWNVDGLITDANEKFLEMVGYSREDLVSGRLNWYDMTPPEYRYLDERAGEELEKTGFNKVPFEKAYIHKDGRRIPILVAAAMLDDKHHDGVAYVLDITERKRAEAALRDNENKLRIFIEHAPAAIAMLDCDMKYIAASQRWFTDYGVRDQDIIGRSHYEIFPDISEQWKKAHRRVLAGAVERNEADPWSRADGHIDWVRWELRPWYQRNNVIGGLIILSENITERKQAEEALRESERKYRSIIDNLLDGYLRINNDGIITMASPSVIQMYGVDSSADLIGTPTSALYKSLEDRSAVLEKIKTQGKVVDFETESLRRDGSSFPVSINARYFHDDQGQIQGIEAFVRDISDRRRIDEELRELNSQLEQRVIQRTRFYTLIAGVNDAIAKYRERHELLTEICKIIVEDGDFKLSWIGMLDATSGEIRPEASWGETSYLDNIRLTVNDEPEGMGPSGRAIVEGRYIVSVDFEQETRMLPWRMSARAHGIRSSSVFPFFNKGRAVGELTIYSDKPSFFTEEEISLLLSIADNISYALEAISAEQKRLEAEESLRLLNEELERRVRSRTADLEATNRELEAFSYSVSHDLRAPLRHMSGYVELLHKSLGDQQDIKTKNYITAIRSASKRMGLLIDELLAFSRVGRTEMKMRMVNLNSIVKAVIEELKPDTESRDISWELEELPDVYGDKSLLRLVMFNLLSNAIKYTSTRLKAEIKVGCKDEGDELVYFVKDNGVGFDMKYVDKLFGVFQRLHTQEEFEGTGIGLANVRRIISRHGGRTWAGGSIGQGATLFFSLPKGKER